jgi:RHS repeat-associated protein
MTDASGTFTYAYTHTRTGRLDHVTGGHGNSPGYDYDGELAQPADRDRAPGLGRPHASIQTAYNYDGDGLRTAVVRGTGSGASTEHYTWDVAGALAELIGDGAKLYLYGPSATPLAQIDTTSGAVDYLHHDINGTTRVLTDDTGTVEATASYDPYGSPTTHTGTAGTAFGYAGEYTDPDTGLVYLRARYYDPQTAQFLTRDPLEATTQQPYQYVGGDPLDARDPSGLDCGWTSPGDCGPSLQQASDWAAGFGDTVTCGGTKQIRRLINYEQTGSTNDIGVDQCDSFYHWGNIGGDFANVFDSIVVPGTVARWASRIPAVGRALYGSRSVGADSPWFGNDSLGTPGVSGSLNQRGAAYRIGWSVNAEAPGGARPVLSLRTPWILHLDFFYGPVFP